MPSGPLRLSPEAQASLRCPRCASPLAASATGDLVCQGAGCVQAYPQVDGIPVLINEANSVFTIDDFVRNRTTLFGHAPSEPGWRQALRRLTPSISNNLRVEQNCRAFLARLKAQNPRPRVLIVGGGFLGEGMHVVASEPGLDLVETDVSFGPRTRCICDGHDLPFADGTFDGVIVQAVLEHVVDPVRCVAEIHRVLKPQGLVYAETPFIQQVHGGRYDFTRYTHLGHRRLFRQFEEIESGATCGPGMALAWSYMHFLMSFASTARGRSLARAFATFTAFPLKYFDHLLLQKPGAYVAASVYYFMGTRSEAVLPDRELLQQFRGMDRAGR